MKEQAKYTFDFYLPEDESEAEDRTFNESPEKERLTAMIERTVAADMIPKSYELSSPGCRLFIVVFSNFYELAREFYGILEVKIDPVSGSCDIKLETSFLDCDESAPQLFNILRLGIATSFNASVGGGFSVSVSIPLFVPLSHKTEPRLPQEENDGLLFDLKKYLTRQQEAAVAWVAERRNKAFGECEG